MTASNPSPLVDTVGEPASGGVRGVSFPRWLAGCSLVGAVVVPTAAWVACTAWDNPVLRVAVERARSAVDGALLGVLMLLAAAANAEYEASRGDRDDADRLAPRWVG